MSGRSAPWLGRAEPRRHRVLFAHIRAAPGLAVTSAAAGVVDSGDRIDPHDDVARAARFGLGFGRVLALLRRCRGGCRRGERYAPALGHEYAFGLAARLNGRLVGAPVVIALPGGLLLRDRGLGQSQQSHHCRTHSEGRFHHTHLREIPPRRPRPAAAAPARRKLPRWQPQCGPQPLTGSIPLFAVRSYFVKNKERTEPSKKGGARGRRRRVPIASRSLSRRQCAVSVEESASTAGSVVTEVSVGLAFSSSHSIGSGLRVSARASTSSMRETGTMSRPFLMLSLISTRSLAFSSGISTVFMPPREAASNFSLRPPIGSTRPRSVISPVIATPADGPSFGVAPSGTCTWMSFLSNRGGSMPKATARMRT